ncbi:MAG: hypothetical protein HYT99_09025 [Candidatus Tectomicrobia bacterium]|nr:hypothetical protein [Candidatus Tectomicrobia bacterium]
MELPDGSDSPPRRESPPVKKLAFQADAPAGPPARLRALIQTLQKNFKFFRGMREDEVLLFLRMCKSRNFKAGQPIACPVEEGDCVCALVTGEVILRAGGGEPFRVEPGAVFGSVPLANGAAAVAGDHALLLFGSRSLLARHMPSVMAEREVCPLGVRSREHGQLCFDCKAGKFFQPLPEVLRGFCKRVTGFRACSYYRAFLEAVS